MLKLSQDFAQKLHQAFPTSLEKNLKQELIEQAQKADKKVIANLHHYLQTAVELEHATIPPYLTAMFSLKNGKNKDIWELIHSVVIEEMLHMTIAANILNALGGSPAINQEAFIPKYPGELPMGIGENEEINLAKYSKDQVDTFIKIEEPEDPEEVRKFRSRGFVESEEVHIKTIGDFYNLIKKVIGELPDSAFVGDPNKQVTNKNLNNMFPEDELFPITNKQTACDAIDIIIEQGEGAPHTNKENITTCDEKIGFNYPVDLSHYYKYLELREGKKIVIAGDGKLYYSPLPKDVIPFDKEDVYNIYPNTKDYMFPEGSEERNRVDEFNLYYAKLLNGLHVSFNGQPDFIQNTLGLMFDLKLFGEKLCATPFPGRSGYCVGPTFQFVELPVLLT